MRKFFGRDLWITSNFALLIVVLVVTVGLLMTSCIGDPTPPVGTAAPAVELASPAPISEPDPASSGTPPTAVAAVPTEVPTQVPTEEPTPTEVPMYVGLPADVVVKLREQCLQENPDSLCLPLPFAPADDAAISVVSELWENFWGVTVADGERGPRFLSLEVPMGTQLLSPLAGEIWVRGFIPSYGMRWLGLPGRTIEGVSSVLFGWEPIAYDSDIYLGSEPSAELTLVKRKDCTGGLYQEGDLFKEPDLVIHGGNRKVTTGEILAQTATSMCLQISAVKPIRVSVLIPPEGGGGTVSGQFPLGRTDLSDLLTTDAGSIVYVLP